MQGVLDCRAVHFEEGLRGRRITRIRDIMVSSDGHLYDASVPFPPKQQAIPRPLVYDESRRDDPSAVSRHSGTLKRLVYSPPFRWTTSIKYPTQLPCTLRVVPRARAGTISLLAFQASKDILSVSNSQDKLYIRKILSLLQ